jgi:hypothetical protein
MLQIQPHEPLHHHDLVKSSLLATHVFYVPFISREIIFAVAQSAVPSTNMDGLVEFVLGASHNERTKFRAREL